MPNVQVIATTIIRLLIGLALLGVALLVQPPDPFPDWLKLAGKIFCIMALMNLFGHFERQFTQHTMRAAQMAWNIIRGRPARAAKTEEA